MRKIGLGVSKVAKTSRRTSDRRGGVGAGREEGSSTHTASAVEIIRDRILDLTLAPGDRIDDKLLMEQFGMGRTPAREAFNRLAAEGLIIIQRNRGAFVRPMDIQHVRQLIDAYGAMERLIGHFCNVRQPGLVDELEQIERLYEKSQRTTNYLDMTRLNSELHKRLAAATENEYIINFSTELYNHARRLSYFIYLTMGFQNTETMQAQIIDHHQDIIEAVAKGDNELLVERLTVHARFFHESIVDSFNSVRGFAAPVGSVANGSSMRGAGNKSSVKARKVS